MNCGERPINTEALYKLIDGDLTILKRLFDAFCEGAHELELSLKSASVAEDNAQVANDAHALRGMTAALMGQRAAKACADLEKCARGPVAQCEVEHLTGEALQEIEIFRQGIREILNSPALR